MHGKKSLCFVLSGGCVMYCSAVLQSRRQRDTPRLAPEQQARGVLQRALSRERWRGFLPAARVAVSLARCRRGLRGLRRGPLLPLQCSVLRDYRPRTKPAPATPTSLCKLAKQSGEQRLFLET